MEESTSSQNKSYEFMREDPTLLVQFVDKYVTVNILMKRCYTGFVHSIDPVSGSVILAIPQEDQTHKTILIPGHAILNIDEEEIPANIKPPRRQEIQTNSSEALLKRKNKVKGWFERNLLPVMEIKDKLVIGDVSLLPPYNITDLCTENPIVAIQIKKVMERMPDDFNS